MTALVELSRGRMALGECARAGVGACTCSSTGCAGGAAAAVDAVCAYRSELAVRRRRCCSFFLRPRRSVSVADDCCDAALHALDMLFRLDMLSADIWRRMPGGAAPSARYSSKQLALMAAAAHDAYYSVVNV